MIQKNKFIVAVILWSLAAILFAITAIGVLAYTYGYRYDFEKQTIFRSGLLAVTTEPKGATITFDGKSKQTPATVKGLDSGNYNFTIEKNGYRPWIGQAEIVPSLATEMKDIQLVASTNTQTSIFEEPIINFWSDTDKAIIELQKWNEDKIQLLDLETGLSQPIFPDLPTVYTVKDVLFAPSNDFVLISAFYRGGTKRFIVDLPDLTYKILPATYNSLSFDNFTWHPYIKNQLFAIQPNKNVETIEINEEITVRPYTEKALAFAVNNNDSIFLRQAEAGSELVSKNLYDENERIITNEIPNAKYYRLLIENDRIFLLASPNSQFSRFDIYLWQPTENNFGQLGTAQNIMAQDKQVIWQNGQEIYRYDLAKDILKLIYTSDSYRLNLLKVFPTTVYLSENAKLKIIDIWGQNIYELSTQKINTNIHIDQKQRNLFFVLGDLLTRFNLKETGEIGLLEKVIPWN